MSLRPLFHASIFAFYFWCIASQNTHTPGTSKWIEHDDLYNLVSGPFDHTCVQDGSWSDAATWGADGVPTTGGDVHIPEGRAVTYDVASSGVALGLVFVEGTLRWSLEVSTAMEVDTIINGVGGRLEIGTEETPVPPDVTHDVLFPAGPIDVAWDAALQSRGLVSHGSVAIHGSPVTPHLKVAADPLAGDSSLRLAYPPQGWRPGDRLVVAGTVYDGYKWNNSCPCIDFFPPQDEVVTIDTVSPEGVVAFSPPLVHNHSAPAGRPDLKTSIGLLTRNVRFRSDPSTPVPERGHVMFMHSPDADIRYAEFSYLGRTDKSTLARSVNRTIEGGGITPSSNVKGRYAFHFHRNGIPAMEDARSPAIAIGNSAAHSAGWCFVHHDSLAFFDRNVAYDCFGAGFSAETGNEVGAWTRNLAVFSQGIQWGDPKNAVDLDEFDTGNSGDCYWFQSRMVRSAENVAASCNNAYSYFHRGAVDLDDGTSQLSFDARAWQLPDALALRPAVGPDDAPIRQFVDNEAFASRTGLHVVKANPNQGHDVHSHLKRHLAWNVLQCAAITYTAHYLLEDFDCVGRPAGDFTGPQHGIGIQNNAGDIVILRPRIEGFPVGFTISIDDTPQYDYRNYVFVNPEFIDVDEEFAAGDFRPQYDTLLEGFAIEPRLEVEFDQQPFYYIEGGDPSLEPEIRKVNITGTKTDSLGSLTIPPVGDTGPDNYNGLYSEVVERLETAGYFTDAEGRRWFVLPDFYTDRGTGEVHLIGRWVQIDDNVQLGNQFFSYANAVNAGNISSVPDTSAPVVEDETVPAPACDTDYCGSVTIDLLSNDADPDGDALSVAAILQPDRGEVYDNGDGTVDYRPDPGFADYPQTFEYWVTDGHANFVKGVVTIGGGDSAASSLRGWWTDAAPLW